MTRAQAIAKLSEHAKEHGLASLAAKLECSRNFASMLIRNKRNIGDPKILRNACEHFKIPYRVWEEKIKAA